MTKAELIHELTQRFDGVAQIQSRSEYRIEVDIAKTLDKAEWYDRIKGLPLEDNSKHIPDSFKHNDIVVVLFYGNLTMFKGKGYFG